MRRILVTRPEPGASSTAQKLHQMGYEPVVLPLTRIESLHADEQIDPAAFAAIAVTSPNAARHVPPSMARNLADLPCYAVGKTTGAVSRAVGLNVIDETAGDAAGLRRIIAKQVEPGSNILVLCGRVRRDILDRGLIEDGFHPRLIEIYDTLPTQPAAEVVGSVLGGTPIDVVLLYSAFAADEFTRLLERMEDHAIIQTASFIAISERIRSHLPASFADRIIVAAEPNEEAMLSLL
jgi:uroporphyrinogen-III synthase